MNQLLILAIDGAAGNKVGPQEILKRETWLAYQAWIYRATNMYALD
jgi:hypothetical protein